MDRRLADAVRKNDRKKVIALLASGVPIDERWDHGFTPLMYAIADGNKSMVDLLLSKGARVNTYDLWGGTPLQYAVSGNHLDIVRTLIAHGSKVDDGGDTGITPLMEASAGGYTKIAEYLIKCGANVNAQAVANGMTALIRAVYHRKYDCVKLLLAHGADKSPHDRDGETAVTYAQKRRDTKALKLLGY